MAWLILGCASHPHIATHKRNPLKHHDGIIVEYITQPVECQAVENLLLNVPQALLLPSPVLSKKFLLESVVLYTVG